MSYNRLSYHSRKFEMTYSSKTGANKEDMDHIIKQICYQNGRLPELIVHKTFSSPTIGIKKLRYIYLYRHVSLQVLVEFEELFNQQPKGVSIYILY